jgi:hypothetical protein
MPGNRYADGLRLRDGADANMWSARVSQDLRAILHHDGNRYTLSHVNRHRAKQTLRPAVVNRKVWGGNRTWLGAWAQSVLTSVQAGQAIVLKEDACDPAEKRYMCVANGQIA